MVGVLLKPGERPKRLVIPDKFGFGRLQAIIGGYVECLHVRQDVALLFDEDGRMKQLPPSTAIDYRGNSITLLGTVVALGLRNGEFVDLPQDYYCSLMKLPEEDTTCI